MLASFCCSCDWTSQSDEESRDGRKISAQRSPLITHAFPMRSNSNISVFSALRIDGTSSHALIPRIGRISTSNVDYKSRCNFLKSAGANIGLTPVHLRQTLTDICTMWSGWSFHPKGSSI